jgi:hypothetical protein
MSDILPYIGFIALMLLLHKFGMGCGGHNHQQKNVPKDSEKLKDIEPPHKH